MKEFDEIKTYLKQHLSQVRYLHSIQVAEEAKKLAQHYHYDESKAYLAGLLHDIAKEFTEEENKKWIEKYQLPSSLLEPKYKKRIHADIGACVAKEYFGCDDEICNAIKYHTIGHFPIGLLDKIILIADKIAREEEIPGLLEEKKLAYQDLDQTIYYYFTQLDKKLKEKGLEMHPNSLELYQFLKKKIEH